MVTHWDKSTIDLLQDFINDDRSWLSNCSFRNGRKMAEDLKNRDLMMGIVELLGRERMSHGVVVKEMRARSEWVAHVIQSAIDHLIKHDVIERPKKGVLRNSNSTISALERGQSPIEGVPRIRKEKRANWRHDATSQVRKARNFNPSLTVQRIVALLPTMEMDELAVVWKNAAKMHGSKGSKSAATMLDAIGHEWSRRAALPVQDWFIWPSTEAFRGSGKLTLSGTISEGMLSYLDYHVGRTRGEAAAVRRVVLDSVFKSTLPPVFPKPYMDAWGDNSSSRRLRKMAETIAAFTRNAKRRDADTLDDAIRDWEDDLTYLHGKYYVGRFGFGWPSTK
ncbi:hypothetical protein EN794_025700 [Mesorhizobium sp. M00.F.Ca.ET.151.01.1.1]|nr:hypothetical protein EN794_025700 [Mesorhizobium sp. M00.F.Ca.ET.151.01.1.1]